MTRAIRLGVLIVLWGAPGLSAAAPDLRVTSFSASPTVLEAGGRIAITDVVQSDGGAATGFTVRYYLSSDSGITSADTLVGSRTVSSLASGATSTATTHLDLPAGATGPYYIGAIADGAGQVAESDETNNATAGLLLEIARSDLTLTALSGSPTPIMAGGQLAISSTVRASGGAASSFVVRFYLSADETITSSDISLGSRTISALASGASSTGTTNVTVPTSALGSYYVGAIVDANGQVAESNETNNAMAGTVVAVVRPDLTVAALSCTPNSLGAGGQLAITDTVNVAGVGVSSFQVRFYLSPDQTITTADTLVGTRTVSSLAVGAPSTATTTVTLPATLNGTFYVGAIVDGYAQITESDESNNTLGGPSITVAKADLSVTSVVASANTALSGDEVYVTDTVRADGGRATSFVVSFLLGSNTGLDASARLLGSRTVPSLAAGASSTGVTKVQIPTGISGLLRIWAVVDYSNQVPESNEQNNRLAGTFLSVKSSKPPPAGTALTYDPAGHLTGIYDVAADPLNCGTVGHSCPGTHACCTGGACGNLSGSTCVPGSTVPSVSLEPASVHVPAGTSRQFTAVVRNAANTALFWDVNGIRGGNAQVGTISSQGFYIAPQNVPATFYVTISAILQSDTSRFATASVIVSSSSSVPLVVNAVVAEYLPRGQPDTYVNAWGLPVAGKTIHFYGSFPEVPAVTADGATLPALLSSEIASTHTPAVILDWSWDESTAVWLPFSPTELVLESANRVAVMTELPTIAAAYMMGDAVVFEGDHLDQLDLPGEFEFWVAGHEPRTGALPVSVVVQTSSLVMFYVPDHSYDEYGREVGASAWYQVWVHSYQEAVNELGEPVGWYFQEQILVRRHPSTSREQVIVRPQGDGFVLPPLGPKPPDAGCSNSICE